GPWRWIPPVPSCGTSTSTKLRAGSGRGRGLLRDFLQFDETTNRIARLGALAEPMLYAVCVQLNSSGLLEWVVRTHRIYNAAVARASSLDHHYAVKGLLFLANPRQTNRQHESHSS